MPPRRSAAQRPTVVLLVRHGRTPTTGAVLPGRAAGLHLSDEGRAQAESVAGRIAESASGRGRSVAAVYASPLERTVETARPIARALGLAVRRHRGLLECDFGEWTGRPLRELVRERSWQTVQYAPASFRFPGGESFTELSARMAGTLEGLAATHPGETVVAVSHADPIKAAVAGAAGTPLDLFQRLVVSPCSVSALAIGSGGIHVLCVNSTASLAELAIS
ncbi:MAG: histidine phosphatase family protein [Actinomycetota bacterium]|nr:histidine phosphatase family protein [Actinomycetota bacterium]